MGHFPKCLSSREEVEELNLEHEMPSACLRSARFDPGNHLSGYIELSGGEVDPEDWTNAPK